MKVILIFSLPNPLYDDSNMSQIKTFKKRKIAVFFGGRSPEHDVSVITGLQVLDAIDSAQYEAFPVYISTDGVWYVGDILRKRENFMLNAARKAQVTEVTLDVHGASGGALIPKNSGLFQKPKPIEFDVAIPAFHGLIGEDGNIQGLFELANIPYTGMRTKASALLMDKVTTKYFLKGLDIPALPFAVLKRPKDGYLISERVIEEALAPLGYPCILKPVNLGSSIGVAKVNNAAEVRACLPAIFEFDCAAIAEPFVKNLVEYNVAVSAVSGEIKTSAIERPKATDELLDFKQKYMSGGDDKSGNKLGGGTKSASSRVSEGMLSLTREINPALAATMEDNIRAWAKRMFDAIDGSGAPRIDFICDGKSGEIWMNEVNPCPGSFGYFLWEAAAQPLFFTDLLSAMIEEAFVLNAARSLPRDPVPQDARLLKR